MLLYMQVSMLLITDGEGKAIKSNNGITSLKLRLTPNLHIIWVLCENNEKDASVKYSFST